MMITDCPSCRRRFRIYAAQLSAAQGLVQCGFCGTQFNALDSLHDQPSQERSGLQHHDEPQFDISQGPAQADYASRALQHDPSDQVDADELVGQLLEAEPQQRTLLATVLWYGGATILLLAGVLQLLWFNRDSLLTRHPEYLPLAKQLCEHLQCDLIRDQDPAAIVLLNRDVRDHPRFNNALLINATIENQSGQTRPYPDILLVLYDTSGKVSAYRRFIPVEYLDASVVVENGLAPHAPLHLVLEVTDTTEAAVSFEFYFL
jgi:predicted Zn finger-like uncharacterized protein